MTGAEMVGVFFAGVGAGTINTVVGSGTLITFPTLLLIGLPAVTANVSNTIGLVPGSVSGTIGYRRELAGQRGRLLRLGVCSLVGGIVGAVLLLTLPKNAFKEIVPALILIAVVLVVVQPWLSRRLAESGREAARERVTVGLAAGVFLAGIYGGYFGAAQGVLLLGLMGLLLADSLQRINATKNVLALLVNLAAAVFFIAVSSDVDWAAAGLIAAGSVIGGQIGALVGRRLPPLVFRLVIVVIGVVAIVQQLS